MPTLTAKSGQFATVVLLTVGAGAAPASANADDETFDRLASQIQANQEHVADSSDGVLRRGVHGKGHGCLSGTLVVDPDRPAAASFGIFRDEATYPVWTRFSNGSPHERRDPLVDARGLGIKVLGVRSVEPGTPTQDFLLINMQQPPGGTPEAFVDFMTASARGELAIGGYLLRHPTIAAIWAKAALHRVKSLATETYFSVTPFALGPHAVKLTVSPSFEAPCGPVRTTRGLFDGRDYLAGDLKRQAAAQSLCFDLSAQFQAADQTTTPIEDAMVIWKTPSYRVARVILPAQEFDSTDQNDYCERLNFTPWHTLEEHRPLGRLNESRLKNYEASQDLRKKDGTLLPEPETMRTFRP